MERCTKCLQYDRGQVGAQPGSLCGLPIYHREGPGSPSFRLELLLEELEKRFPYPEGSHYSYSFSPEEWVVKQVDKLLQGSKP